MKKTIKSLKGPTNSKHTQYSPAILRYLENRSYEMEGKIPPSRDKRRIKIVLIDQLEKQKQVFNVWLCDCRRTLLHLKTKDALILEQKLAEKVVSDDTRAELCKFYASWIPRNIYASSNLTPQEKRDIGQWLRTHRVQLRTSIKE